jgi:hypothetical protein
MEDDATNDGYQILSGAPSHLTLAGSNGRGTGRGDCVGDAETDARLGLDAFRTQPQSHEYVCRNVIFRQKHMASNLWQMFLDGVSWRSGQETLHDQGIYSGIFREPKGALTVFWGRGRSRVERQGVLEHPPDAVEQAQLHGTNQVPWVPVQGNTTQSCCCEHPTNGYR